LNLLFGLSARDAALCRLTAEDEIRIANSPVFVKSEILKRLLFEFLQAKTFTSPPEMQNKVEI